MGVCKAEGGAKRSGEAKALAKSAVRRISSISAAANRLNDRIEARKSAITSGTEWVPADPTQKALLFEQFDGLSRQVAEIRDNIAASEGDWRDILPEEFAKKEEVERKILQEREIAIEAREKAFAEAQQTLKRGEGKTAEQLAAPNSFARKCQAILSLEYPHLDHSSIGRPA